MARQVIVAARLSGKARDHAAPQAKPEKVMIPGRPVVQGSLKKCCTSGPDDLASVTVP
jgi:hypothetical protein